MENVKYGCDSWYFDEEIGNVLVVFFCIEDVFMIFYIRMFSVIFFVVLGILLFYEGDIVGFCKDLIIVNRNKVVFKKL